MHRKLPIFYSALLLTGVNLLLRLVSTSFQVHISARLGAEGVGLLQLVMSVGGLAMTAAMAGIRTTAMYLTAEDLGKKRPGNVRWVLLGCFGYSLLCSVSLSIFLYAAAPWLAKNWIGNSETVTAIRLFAAFLPVVCMCGCMTGYFTAANRIGTLAVVEILEQLCYMFVTMFLLTFWAGHDPGKACASVVLGSGFSAGLTLLCLLYLRKKEKSPTGPRIRVRKRLLSTAVPLALADDLKAGISTGENLMVPKRLALYPGEENPLASFGTVCAMVFPVLMFPAAILFSLAELLIPELARCNAAGSSERVQYLAKRSLKIALLYACLCGGILFLISGPLCRKLYQSDTAGRYLGLYSLLIPMLYCDAIVDAMNKGLGQQKICVRFNILTAVMDLAGLYLLLPKYGMDGYFISFLASHLVNFLLSLGLLLKTAHVRIPFYIPALTCASAMTGCLGAGFLSTSLPRLVAFAGIYGSLLVLFRVVSREDFRWAKGLVFKEK